MMAHTPGIFYAIAYWASALLTVFMAPRRYSTISTICLQLLFLLALSFLMTVSDGIKAIFIPMMLLYVALIFLFLFSLCRYDLRTSIYFTVKTFIVGEFIASFIWQVFLYAARVLQFQTDLSHYVIVVIGVLPLVMAGLYLFEKGNRKVNRSLTITTHEMVSALIIGVAVFIISNLSYMWGETIFSVELSRDYFLVRTIVDLAGVAILFAYHYQLTRLKVRREYERLEEILHTQHTNYEIMEQSMAVINQKYHDLKYQIQAIRNGLENEEGLAYLDQIEKDIKFYEAQNRTGNSILDTILTGKSIQCQQLGIQFTTVIDGKILDFISTIDLATLFGNMLDNAIESVQKIEELDERLIHLMVTEEKGFARIRLENRFVGELEYEDGLPKTTKSQQEYHGFGLKSIQDIVHKYDGTLSISDKNAWFELRILIPLYHK